MYMTVVSLFLKISYCTYLSSWDAVRKTRLVWWDETRWMTKALWHDIRVNNTIYIHTVFQRLLEHEPVTPHNRSDHPEGCGVTTGPGADTVRGSWTQARVMAGRMEQEAADFNTLLRTTCNLKPMHCFWGFPLLISRSWLAMDNWTHEKQPLREGGMTIWIH